MQASLNNHEPSVFHRPVANLSHTARDGSTWPEHLTAISFSRLRKSSGYLAQTQSPALPPCRAAAGRVALPQGVGSPSRLLPATDSHPAQFVLSNTRKERLVRAASLPAGGYRAALRGRVSRGRKPGCVGALRRVSPQSVLSCPCNKGGHSVSGCHVEWGRALPWQ